MIQLIHIYYHVLSNLLVPPSHNNNIVTGCHNDTFIVGLNITPNNYSAIHTLILHENMRWYSQV